jgi:hypothetical protein
MDTELPLEVPDDGIRQYMPHGRRSGRKRPKDTAELKGTYRISDAETTIRVDVTDATWLCILSANKRILPNVMFFSLLLY